MTNQQLTEPPAWSYRRSLDNHPDAVLAVACPQCRAVANESCRDQWGNVTHRARVDRYHGVPVKAKTPEYDGRFTAGFVLVIIGCIVALIAALTLSNGSDEYDYSYTGQVGFISFGGFVILLGVILIAGAQRIER